VYISKLPVKGKFAYSNVPDIDFLQKYSEQHFEEHQLIVSGINALLDYLGKPKLKNVEEFGLVIWDKTQWEIFFKKNFEQHLLFYSKLNEIGSSLTVPVFVAPKLYPSMKPDFPLETFFFYEWQIHNLTMNAINKINQTLGI